MSADHVGRSFTLSALRCQYEGHVRSALISLLVRRTLDTNAVIATAEAVGALAGSLAVIPTAMFTATTRSKVGHETQTTVERLG
jgi:hypothetical protein